jgi:leader peptidase (prepilin peptidase)/N-methyltransferase
MFIAAILFTFGLCFGSFVNALVWRVHEKKDFVKARSQCVHCGHILAAADLVPVFSWLILKGKCSYCGKSISRQYPTVELIGGLMFALSYAFWPVSLNDPGHLVQFIGWLATSIGLLALALYDFKWMLLPNKILYPVLLVAVTTQLVYLIGYSDNKSSFLLNWAFSLLISSGLYFALFIISSGRWIGFGDVRLGLITGTVLHKPALSFLMIFTASLLGLIVIVPSIFAGKKELTSKLPYGPFLILATFICLLFGDRLIDFYTTSFIS